MKIFSIHIANIVSVFPENLNQVKQIRVKMNELPQRNSVNNTVIDFASQSITSDYMFTDPTNHCYHWRHYRRHRHRRRVETVSNYI